MAKAHDPRDWENSQRYPLSRGHVRIKAIRDLADGLSLNEMATKYNVHRESIILFKQRHKDDIQRLRQAVAEEVVGLWIADKTNRMWEYQQAAEDLEEAVRAVLNTGATLTKEEVGLLAEKRKIFRHVAEELGQLPPRNAVEVHGATVTYHFEGIDPNDAK